MWSTGKRLVFILGNERKDFGSGERDLKDVVSACAHLRSLCARGNSNLLKIFKILCLSSPIFIILPNLKQHIFNI